MSREDLLAMLVDRAAGRRRLPVAEAMEVYLHKEPHHRGQAYARSAFMAALTALKERGDLQFPVTAWDRVQLPHIPTWVRFPVAEQATVARERIHAVPWHPRLEFVLELPRVSVREFEDLLAVQRFLVEPATDGVLTVRERSVRLLGDDKRLDALMQGRLFEAGRLDATLLRLRVTQEPLTFSEVAAGSRVLIVENRDTYFSACRGLVDNPAGIRWVIYGAGNAVVQRLVGAADWSIQPREWFYFGDVDAHGVEIALRVHDLLERLHGAPLLPARGLYKRVLDAAEQHGVELPGTMPSAARVPVMHAWFGGDLGARVGEVVSKGLRLPQELVTEADMRAWSSMGAPA